MTTFYICRHGETENNKNGRLSGWIDTPLTEEGLRNVQATAVKLKGIQFDSVHSSDLGRAFRTAYLITRTLAYSDEIYCHKGLREVNYGDLSNAPYAGTDSVYPELSALDNTNYIPANGESLAQMQERVIACIDIINQENPGKTILIAAHDGTINAIYSNFTKRDIGVVDADRTNPHDFVAKFTITDSSITSFVEV